MFNKYMVLEEIEKSSTKIRRKQKELFKKIIKR